MKTSGWRPGATLLVVALIGFASVAQAATTEVSVNLGDSFTGTIGAAGVDTVHALLNVAEGTSVKVTATALPGSSLRPTVVVRDGTGAAITAGPTVSIEWLPVSNVVQYFTTPADGRYVVEIGGSGGSGGFSAKVEGALPSGTNMVTISGRVTNVFTGEGVEGAMVSVGPYVLMTDASGNYSGRLPAGSYTATVTASDFLPSSQAVDLTSAATLNVALTLTTPAVVTTDVSGDVVPGGAVTATVDVELRDGSTVQSINWTQTHGVPVTITGGTTDTATVTLSDIGAYKAQLLMALAEPPITAAQLPPNVPVPEGEFPGGLQDRFQVVGISPFAAEEAGVVTLEVEVTTSGGDTLHEEVELHAPLPWAHTPGLRNVPVGVPVLLYGKDQASYDWAMSVPAGSSAALADATMQAPDFIPDVPGIYEVTVTDLATAEPVTLEIYAGSWRGVIVGQTAEGLPVSDPGCTVCHNDILAEDAFTPWETTGHAEIFEDNLNTSTHYGPNCFPCHTVGYDVAADNNGSDDATDYDAFLGAGLINNPGDNWTTVLESYPETAQLANIQCENCHGPQSSTPGSDSAAHGWGGPDGEPRVSLSSDVCAVCHGEPLRHARFQQWQLSGHANYELAIDEGESGSCSRCHTANGFLAWLPVLLDDDPETDPLASVEVDWEIDETHPQTCVTCHDPHDIGDTSGGANNATTRISGDTPPLIAGFTATDVGRGAICMTCHNSRRGLRNDANFAEIVGTSEAARAPHGSAQTDVLMGENAYFVEVGNRGNHSMIEDTCTNCHLARTPPPDLLAYNQGGSNHTFFAGKEICADCHGTAFTADSVQGGVQGFLDRVEPMIEQGYMDLISAQTALGNSIDLNGAATITDAADVTEIQFGETRGRQAIAVTFTDGSTFGLYRIPDIDVLDPTGSVLGGLQAFADERLLKSGWNWNLFNNDGSVGVHNPTFAWQTLIATRDQLSALLDEEAVTETNAQPALLRTRTTDRVRTIERLRNR